MKIQSIPVSEIQPPQYVLRENPEERESMEELIQSIQDVGLISPILVTPADGVYRVIAGHRRLLACIHLGWQEIPARIVATDNADVLAMSVQENFARKDLSATEICGIIKELIINGEYSIPEVAQICGKTSDWVRRYYDLAIAPSDIHEALRRGNLPVGVIEVLAKVKDDSTRTQYISYAEKYGITIAEARRWLDYYTLHSEEISSRLVEHDFPELRGEMNAIYVSCAVCGERVRVEETTIIRLCRACASVSERDV